MTTINAWAVSILDEELGGYRYIEIKKSVEEASQLAQEVGGTVIPIKNFDWVDMETPFDEIN